MIRYYILIIITCATFSYTFAQVSNTSFINDGGEKVLQLSIVLPIEKSETCKLFTTDSGLVKWIAPVAKINLKTVGWIKTNYNPQKSLDDSTTIKLDIINYLKE